MIQIIIGTLRFLEARIIFKAQKENRLFSHIVNLYFFPLLFHLLFLIPLFFSRSRIIQSILGVCILSLIPFSILFIRVLLFINSENKLSKTLECYEKDLNSLKNMITSGIKTNLIACSVFYVFLLIYSFFIYGVLSLFLSHSLIFFFISFPFFGLSFGIILFCIFLYSYLKGKDLLWPKIILPGLSCLFTFLLLLAVNLVSPLHPLLIYMCSFSSGWYFTYPLLKKLLGDKKLIITFRLILFCYIIILIILFVSTLIPGQFDNLNGIPFLQPVLDTLISLFSFIHTFLVSNPVFSVLFPHFFIPVLLLCRTIYSLASRFRQQLIPEMFGSQKNVELIFSSSLSLYHLFWLLFRAFLITGIVYLEIGPVSDSIDSLFKLFKISEIFHLDFLTRDTITFFFTLIFYIILLILGLKCLDKTFMHLCSTFSFFSVDFSTEIVYVEKRLLSKSVFRIPLKKIHYIMYHQNICERCFDTGTIRIETSDISGIISIRGIPCIKEKYNLLIEKVKSAV